MPRIRFPVLRVILAIGPAAFASACAVSDVPGPVVVRDSAGVRIVENLAPVWAADSMVWSIVPDPEIAIGVAEGDPRYELQGVVDAERLDDGRILVADARAAQVRVFAASGEFGRVIGRRGEGPGEFRNLGAVWRLRADSIVTYDRALRRITVFDTAGTFGRMAALGAAGGALVPAAEGVFLDGSLLVYAAPNVTPADGAGVHRKDGALIHYDAAGNPLEMIAPLAGEEWVGVETGGGLLLMQRPFPRNGFVALAGDRVYAADSDIYEVRVYDATGSLHSLIRRPGPPTVVTGDEIARYIASQVEAVGDPERQRAIRTRLEAVPFASTWPEFAGLEVDRAGNIWLTRPRRPGDAGTVFTVFDADGRMLGDVDAPARTRVHAIGEDWLLGRHTDELGVQRIVLHRIVKENR